MCILITTTAPNDEVAKRIVDALLAQGLAACVQLQNIESHYVWDGEIQQSQEVLLYIKTTQALYNAAEQALIAIHPYDVPQIIALPITDGFAPYLDWVQNSTKNNALLLKKL